MLLVAPCAWVLISNDMRRARKKLSLLDHAKLMLMYLSIPLNLQYIIYVILGGVGYKDLRRREVGRIVIGCVVPNAFYQIFIYVCLVPFLSIIYSLRDCIDQFEAQD